MNTETPLPPHLEHIGRQLTAAAHELNAPRRSHRPRVLLAPVAAMALIAVVVLGTTTATDRGTPTRPHRPVAIARTGSKPPAVKQTRPSLPPLSHPTAAKVLARAAYVALQTTSTTPSPDQFIYTETETGAGQIAQSWFSVDGTRTSITEQPGSSTQVTTPGCVNGEASSQSIGEDGKPLSDFIPKRYRGTPLTLEQVATMFFGGKLPMDGPIVTTKCTPQPAFFPDMPTTADAMQAYLVKTGNIYPVTATYTAEDELNNLAKNVGWILDTDYLLPAQQAALYEFIATTPGITIEQGVKDVAGRSGIGVGWTFSGSSAMLIFDPTTYQYLGMTTTGEQGQVAGDALLQTAIVDTAGVQPPADSATPAQQQPGTGTSTADAAHD